MEVAPGVHRITAQFSGRNLYQHVLIGERVVVYDTGAAATPQAYILPYLHAHGIAPERIDLVVNSHSDLDHHGGNAAIRQAAPRSLLLAHEYDVPAIESPDRYMKLLNEFGPEHGIGYSDEVNRALRAEIGPPVPVDIALRGGERLRLAPDWTVRVLHAPGHRRGHLALHDSAHRLAVVTDAVLWKGLLAADGSMAFAPTYRYTQPYLSTIQLLEGLDLELLLTSHYPLIEGRAAVADFLAESRNFALRLEEQILNALRRSGRPLTLMQLVDETNDAMGAWPRSVRGELASPLMGGLEWLEQIGRVRRVTAGDRPAWELT